MTSLAAVYAPPGENSGGRAGAARRRRRPTDKELQAFMDGELDDARAAEVKAALRRDSKLRRTADVYRMLDNAVRRLYDRVLVEPIPERLRSCAASSDPERSC